MSETARTSHMVSRVGQSWWNGQLWSRWIFANAVGELLGLSLAAIAGATLVRTIEKEPGAWAILLGAGLMILVGTFEGVVVGVAQWLVLRHWLPELSRRVWVLATAAGAFAAWVLGMFPSTAMSLQTPLQTGNAAAPPPEFNDLIVYGLAALLGIVAGAILGFPQWLALRRYFKKARLWVAANSLAWAVGMPIVFIGAGSVPDGAVGAQIAAIIAATIFCAGAAVGAIHGIALLWLLESKRTEGAS